jgi:hypothetical protein
MHEGFRGVVVACWNHRPKDDQVIVIIVIPLKSNLPGALYRVKEHEGTNELTQLKVMR